MKMFWKIAIPATCVALICGAAITWQVNKAKANERKLADAAAVCRQSAERGDAKAQFDLGHMYYHGQGVQQNLVEAAQWYHKAAEQGHAKAQYGLGYMYQLGQGVPQNYTEAARWYRKAADQGYAKAQTNLASMYGQGLGVPQDYAESIRLYRKSADQGDATGQDGLGFVYYHGYGVPQDRAEADRWYHKAADQGDEYAKRALGLKGPGLSTFSKFNLSVMFLGCLLILVSSRLPSRRLRDRQRRTATLAGLLGITFVAMSVFGSYHFGIRQPGSAVAAFYFAKSLLGGIAVVMFLSIVVPESAKPRGAKIALGISGILFIAFNVLAMAHHDLVRLTPTIRTFSLVNGQLVGLSVSLATFLWLAYKKSRLEPNRNREIAAPEAPAASGAEPNHV